uniref:Uncharacterized protein n=1 Tax=Anguilla anguilla TaxID=7936 RepID=A0A0E9QM33_ANGAN
MTTIRHQKCLLLNLALDIC